MQSFLPQGFNSSWEDLDYCWLGLSVWCGLEEMKPSTWLWPLSVEGGESGKSRIFLFLIFNILFGIEDEER